MLRKTIDKLLVRHFSKHPDTSRLDHLEQDVWRKIRMQATDITLPWYEKMVLAFSVPQFRFASIVMAVVIGLSLSYAMPLFSEAATSELMGLKIFAADTPFLLTNQIAGS